MAYVDLADVQARLARHGALSDTSKPTTAQALDMIDGVAAEIDAALASHEVSVPVSSPAGLVAYLKALNTWGAAAEILRAMFQDKQGPNANVAADLYENRYQAGMKRLWAGDMIDQLADSSGELPGSYFTRNPVTAEVLGANAEPSFGMDTKF